MEAGLGRSPKENNFKVLATEGLPLGGDHIDQLLFKEFLSPSLGKGELWSRVRDGKLVQSEFPFDEIEEKLLNWTVTYMLNQNQYRSNIVERINQGGSGTQKFERLLDLITNNYSYLVFQEIRKAKAAISSSNFSQIDIPELDLTIDISRADLERIMALKGVGNKSRAYAQNILESFDSTSGALGASVANMGSALQEGIGSLASMGSQFGKKEMM